MRRGFGYPGDWVVRGGCCWVIRGILRGCVDIWFSAAFVVGGWVNDGGKRVCRGLMHRDSSSP